MCSTYPRTSRKNETDMTLLSVELYAFARHSLILVKALTTFTNLYLVTQFRWLTRTKTGRFVSFAFLLIAQRITKKELSKKIDFLRRAFCHAAPFLIVMLHESCDNSPPGIEFFFLFRKVPASFL